MTEYRDVIAQFASGVAIVATSALGRNFGMIATSLLSLEPQPPLVAIGLLRGGSTPLALQSNGTFSISLLSDAQRELAELYADRRRQHERQADLARRRRSHGVPAGFDGMVELICVVDQVVPVAAHDLVIAGVIRSRVGSRASRPLIRHASRHGSLATVDDGSPSIRTINSRTDQYYANS